MKVDIILSTHSIHKTYLSCLISKDSLISCRLQNIANVQLLSYGPPINPVPIQGFSLIFYYLDITCSCIPYWKNHIVWLSFEPEGSGSQTEVNNVCLMGSLRQQSGQRVLAVEECSNLTHEWFRLFPSTLAIWKNWTCNQIILAVDLFCDGENISCFQSLLAVI